MRRARRPRLQGATTKAIPVWIVEEERRRRRGPDRTRARARVRDRAPAPPAPGGLAGPCVTLMRAHVSGPPADVGVFMNTGTKPEIAHRTCKGNQNDRRSG